MSPLMYAVVGFGGHLEMVKLLLKSRVDLNAEDQGGNTALALVEQAFKNSTSPEYKQRFQEIIHLPQQAGAK